MSECIHTVYKDGKPVLREIIPNKGYEYEDRIFNTQEPNNAEKNPDEIWRVRRDMGDLH